MKMLLIKCTIPYEGNMREQKHCKFDSAGLKRCRRLLLKNFRCRCLKLVCKLCYEKKYTTASIKYQRQLICIGVDHFGDCGSVRTHSSA